MAEEKSILPDPTKLPMFGSTEAQWNDIYEAQKQALSALEARYAQPNLFKVAAGFLKPQLGGFGASLGSASEALAENIEQQRAQALPIAQARAQVAQYGFILDAKRRANAIVERAKAEGRPLTAQELRDVSYIDPALADQIAKSQELQKGATGVASGSLNLQQQVLNAPALRIEDINNPSPNVFNRTDEQVKDYIGRVSWNKPDYISQEIWNMTPFPEKERVIAKQLEDVRTTNMAADVKAADSAGKSSAVLNQLYYLRNLGADKDLSELFSLFKNGDVFSQFKAFLDKYPGRPQQAVDGFVNATFQNLSNQDPRIRAKVDKLVKGIAELEIRTRGTVSNPTDAASAVISNATPSLIANSQAGFVGILDKLALDSYEQIEKSRLHNELARSGKFTAQTQFDDEMRNLNTRIGDLSSQILQKNPEETLSSMPDWYKPDWRGMPVRKPENKTPSTRITAKELREMAGKD